MKINVNGRVLWVNYHHLYCFYVVVTEGGLTQAAKVLGIGQSALSIQMKQFEECLGFSLFERSHRSLAPNEMGKVVLSYAREIFKLGGEMVETLFDQPIDRRVHVRIGALDTIPKHLVVQLVQAAREVRECVISVVEGGPDFLLEELRQHRIDLMCSNGFPNAEPDQVYVRRIARVPLWVAGGDRYRKFAAGFPGSIQGQPMVLPTPDSRVRSEFESYCRHRGIDTEIQVETQDVMVQKLLALRGLGMTVVPEFAIREYVQRRELFLLGKLQGAFEELFLVAASRKLENPVAAVLMRKFRIDGIPEGA